jgi:hypothetical protein
MVARGGPQRARHSAARCGAEACLSGSAPRSSSYSRSSLMLVIGWLLGLQNVGSGPARGVARFVEHSLDPALGAMQANGPRTIDQTRRASTSRAVRLASARTRSSRHRSA